MRARVIAITSGKGGAGKSNITVNLAIALAQSGARICVFDADINLANINILLGKTPENTLEHFINGSCDLHSLLLEGPASISILPGASGVTRLTSLDELSRQRLVGALETLEQDFDYILIDTPAGIDSGMLKFIRAADYSIVIVTPEPTSLTDAFALLRIMKKRHHRKPVHVLVNMALNYSQSMEVYSRFHDTVNKYLQLPVHYLGYIAEDRNLKRAVGKQQPVILLHPDTYASRCIRTLAEVILDKKLNIEKPHSLGEYWSHPGTAMSPPPRPAQQEHDREQAKRLAVRLGELMAGGAITAREGMHHTMNLLQVIGKRVAAETQSPDGAARLTSELTSDKEVMRAIQSLLADTLMLVEKSDSGTVHRAIDMLLKGGEITPQALRRFAAITKNYTASYEEEAADARTINAERRRIALLLDRLTRMVEDIERQDDKLGAAIGPLLRTLEIQGSHRDERGADSNGGAKDEIAPGNIVNKER